MANQVDLRRRALQDFMIVHKLSARTLCKAAGLSPTVVTQFLNDPTRDMIARTWEKLAAGASKELGRDIGAAELQGERGPLEIEVVSYVGAGAEVFPIDGDRALDAVEAPPGFVGSAMIVRGDSGVPMFEDGDTLFVAPSHKNPARFVGKVVVVQVKDGPRLVKRLLRGGARNRFDLQSINPAAAVLADRHVVEVAAIHWVKKRAI